MKNVTVQWKLFILIGTALLLLLAMGGTSYVNSERLARQASVLYHSNLLSISYDNQLRANHRALEAYLLELMLTTDPLKGEQLHKNMVERQGHITELEKNMEQQLAFWTTDEAKDWQMYKQLSGEAYRAVLAQVAELASRNNNKEAYAIYVSKVSGSVEQLNEALIRLSSALQEDADRSDEAMTREAESIRLQNVLILGIGAIALLAIGLYISRGIVRPVRQLQGMMSKAAAGDMTIKGDYASRDELGQLTTSFNVMMDSLRNLMMKINDSALTLSASSEELTASAEQTTLASEQISTAMNQMAAGFDTQAQTTQAAATAAGQMAGHISDIEAGGQEVGRLSTEAAGATAAGAEAIRSIKAQMNAIDSQMRTTQELIVRLGSYSDQIGTIVTAINDIANQTNLLSLNASIEAARAGEAGLGFAVVAGEIRKLADAAGRSSNEIGGLIATIQSDTRQAVEAMRQGALGVGQGVERSGQAASAFEAIELTVQRMADKIGQVGSLIETVNGESKQIASSMTRISALSQEGAAAVEQTSASSEEQHATMEEVFLSSKALAQLAEELQTELAKFKL